VLQAAAVAAAKACMEPSTGLQEDLAQTGLQAAAVAQAWATMATQQQQQLLLPPASTLAAGLVS
jgi:hypothetical protein